MLTSPAWSRNQPVACMQEAIVRRVDPGLGMLLELRSGSAPKGAAAQQNGGHAGGAEPVLAGYAHISAVSDKRIEKLEKVRSSPLMHPFGRVMTQAESEGRGSGTHDQHPRHCAQHVGSRKKVVCQN